MYATLDPAGADRSATKTTRGDWTRRGFIGLGVAMLSGCVSAAPHSDPTRATVAQADAAPAVPDIYQELFDEGYVIPALVPGEVPPRFWRSEVDYLGPEAPGTLVVDTPAKYLYHILSDRRATRYGVGVGREGFAWAGRAKVAYKRKWPRWTPPDTMVNRQPELEPYSIANGGMDPGLRNPLGARALYIHEGNRDTLYRLHATDRPNSIGKSVSSGCIRLLSQDVIHLYDTVRDGSPIVVIPDPAMTPLSLA